MCSKIDFLSIRLLSLLFSNKLLFFHYYHIHDHQKAINADSWWRWLISIELHQIPCHICFTIECGDSGSQLFVLPFIENVESKYSSFNFLITKRICLHSFNHFPGRKVLLYQGKGIFIVIVINFLIYLLIYFNIFSTNCSV